MNVFAGPARIQDAFLNGGPLGHSSTFRTARQDGSPVWHRCDVLSFKSDKSENQHQNGQIIDMTPHKVQSGHPLKIPAATLNTFVDAEDTVAKAIVKKPVAVYIEKVYKEGDFSRLSIGT